MIKNAQGTETINDQIVNVYYDLENSITTCSANINTGTPEQPANNTLQVIKNSNRVSTNYTGAGLTSDMINLEAAIRTWLNDVEPGKVNNLKNI
jgi:hypothetical protein